MYKILVTGGSGFIGSAICRMLVNSGNHVTSFDNYSRNKSKKIPNIKYIKGDITNSNDLHKIKGKFDIVFHLAFINGTKFFYKKPKDVINVGILGAINIMNFSKKKRIKEFYLASSSEVYQTPDKIPTDEKEIMKVPDAYNPRYSYGSSKIMSEMIVIHYGKSFLKKLVIFRPHNVYGPGMGNEHVIPEIINKIKKNYTKKKNYIVIQGSGNETRTFNYISDFVNGIKILINPKCKSGTYNIGDNHEIKIKDLINKIIKIMNLKMTIKNSELRKGSTLRRVPNINKIKKLGYVPMTSLNQGLKETIAWYFKN